MQFELPTIAAADPIVDEIVGDWQTGSFQSALERTEALYSNFRFREDVTERFQGLLPDTDEGHRARALYIQAFGVKATRYAEFRESLTAADVLEQIAAYLENRPPDEQNGWLINEIRHHWAAPKPKAARAATPDVESGLSLIVVADLPSSDQLEAMLSALPSTRKLIISRSRRIDDAINQLLADLERDNVESIAATKVDLELDQENFSICRRLAKDLVSSCVPTKHYPGNSELIDDVVWTIAHDAIAVNLGFERLLKDTIDELKPSCLCCFGSEAFVQTIERCFETTVISFKALSDNKVEAIRVSREDNWKPSALFPPSRTSRHHVVSAQDAKDSIVYHFRSADRQSLGNAQGLVSELAASRRLLLECGWFDAHSVDADETNNLRGPIGYELSRNRAELVLSEEIPLHSNWTAYPTRAAMLSAAETMINELCNGKDTLGGLALCIGLPAIDRELRSFYSALSKWYDALEQSRALLVSPGRNAIALAMTLAAVERNIPTYELQNGTISGTGRFLKPLSETVFVNDEFSMAVYADVLGKPHSALSLVGSPRLDLDLKPARGVSVEEARIVQFGAKAADIPKVALFASQPFELPVCRQLLRTVVDGLMRAGKEWHLILRLHPAEGEKHMCAYEDVFSEMGFPMGRLLPSSGYAYDVAAADVVLTYYSTIALEGLALRRPVIAVTPSAQGDIPFDICKMGAQRASTGLELATLLTTEFPPLAPPVVAKANSAVEISQAIEAMGVK